MSRRRSGTGGGDRRAQSEVIGVILLLGIASLGIAGVVLYGDTALNGLQSESEIEAVEQAMTVFDSRAALVALGETDVQTVSMRQTSEGGYSVHPASAWATDPKAGSIKITHLNYDGAGTDVVLYGEKGVGSVIYETGGTEIAYQGGGVWKKSGGGEARMLSPPELYYQGSTLTLPIIQAQGSGGGGGGTSATIRSLSSGTPVYPSSATYPNGKLYQNSITNGEIKITIQSEYAAAWADYFVERTGGEMCPSGTLPTTNSACTVGTNGNTVEVMITSLGTQGPFPMPPDESFLSVDGFLNDHPSFDNSPYDPQLEDFQITLRPDNADSADFANLQWSLYVKQGNQEFEIHLRKGSGQACSPTNPLKVSATIYYTNDYGKTYQGWYSENVFTTDCGDFDGDNDDEIRLVADLAGSKTMTYGSLSQSKLGDEISVSGGASLTDPVTFDQHTGDTPVGGGTRTYGTGSTETMGKLMDHYFTLLGPSFTLTVDDKNSNTISEDASRGVIRYPTTENSITFIHVTENEIEVEFE